MYTVSIPIFIQHLNGLNAAKLFLDDEDSKFELSAARLAGEFETRGNMGRQREPQIIRKTASEAFTSSHGAIETNRRIK
jgi:hypothetical protein